MNKRSSIKTLAAAGAMALGALGLPDLLAFGHRARAGRQALEVGAHINVPTSNLLGSGRSTHAWEGGGLGGCTQAGH
jgi:hypothetical protein